MQNIAAWKHAHPRYRAVLWYDAANMLANTIRKKAKKAGVRRQSLQDVRQSALLGTRDTGRIDVLAQKAQDAGKHQKDDFYNALKAGSRLLALRRKLDEHGVEGRDIRAGQAKSFSNMSVYNVEMANETPNLGAASDVLRLEILIEHGGLYMDVDLGFIEAIPDPLQVREDLALFGIYNTRSCNALIAACAGSDLLKECRASITESYKQLDVSAALRRQYDADMRGFTVQQTGPSVLRSAAGRAEQTAATKRKVAMGGEASMNWAIQHVYFPDGYVDWDTPASKVHRWI